MNASEVEAAKRIIELAEPLGKGLVNGIIDLFKTHRPELLPADLPERSDDTIAAETEELIKKKFGHK